MANKFNGRLQVFGPAGTNYSTFFQLAGTTSGGGTEFTVTNGDGTSVVYGGIGLSESGGILSGTITSVAIKNALAATVATLTSTLANPFLVDIGGLSIFGGIALYNQLLSGDNLIVGSTNGVLGNPELLSGGAGDDVFTPGNGFTSITGGLGVDTLDLSGFAGPVTVNLLTVAGLQHFTVNGETGSLVSVNRFIGTNVGDTFNGGEDGSYIIESGAGNDDIDAFGAGLFGAKFTVDAGVGDDTVTINQFGFGSLSGGDGNDTLRVGGDIRYYNFTGFETVENFNFIRARTEQLQYVNQITDSNNFNGDQVGIELRSGGTIDFDPKMAPNLTVNVSMFEGGTRVNGTSGNDVINDFSGFGNPNQNVVTGAGGDDTINNNSGTAIATFSGNMADYSITQPGGLAPPYIITDNRPGSPDGADTLVFFNPGQPLLRFRDYTASINEQIAYKADNSQLPAQIYNGVLQLEGPDNFDYANMFPSLDHALSATLSGAGTTYTVSYAGGIQVVFSGTGLTTSSQFVPSGGVVNDIKVIDASIPGSPIELAHFYSDPATNHIMRVPFTTNIMTGGERVYQQLLVGNNHVIGSPNDDTYTADIGNDTYDFGGGVNGMVFGPNFVSVNAVPGPNPNSYTIQFVDEVGDKAADALNWITQHYENVSGGGNFNNLPPPPKWLEFFMKLFGDPHVITADGAYYDFQAKGEFTFAKSTVPGDTFEVQARMVTVPFRPSVTAVQAVAMAVGTDRVTIDATRVDVVFVNGASVDLSGGPAALNGGTIELTSPQNWRITYASGEIIDVSQFQGFLDLQIDPGATRAPGTLRGLGGNFDGNVANDFQLPDGTVLGYPLSQTELISDFGEAWRVTDLNTLFDYGIGQSTATFTDKTLPLTFSLADLPPEVFAAAANLVAEAGIQDPALKNSAIYDYIVTGDTSFITRAANTDAAAGSGFLTLAQTQSAPTVDALGVIATDVSVIEAASGDTGVTFTVFRTGTTLGNVVINYSVSDPGAGYFDATDYTGGVLPSGNVTILDGQSTATLTVNLVAGAVTLANELVKVSITGPVDSLVIAPDAQAEVVNNAPATGATAEAEFIKLAGGGTLTHVGNAWTLNLGTITENTALADIRLAVANMAPASGNDLSGMFDVIGALAAITGASTFLKLDGGGVKGGITADIDTSKPGALSTTLTLHTSESNSTGFSATLGDETLAITSNITDVVDVITGTAAANTLTGENGVDIIRGLGGNDTMSGLGFNDILTGGTGRDIMSGGLGFDDFDFNALNEMGKTAGTRDRITDFTHGQDDIDLRTIDANSKISHNQNFKFIATQAFHHKAGELHYRFEGASKTIVEGDTNGDGKADFQIELVGLVNLTKGDFVL